MKQSGLLSVLIVGLLAAGCQQPAPSEENAGGGGYDVDPAKISAMAESGNESAAATPHYEKAVVTTAEYMKILIDPTYEDLKDAIENPPQKRKEWRALYVAAFNLAETTNLLFSRDDEDYTKTPEWIEHSLKAQNLTTTLGESIRNQSEYDVMKENYLAVMRNCNDCHREFKPGEVDEIVPPRSWDEKVEEDPNKIVIQ